MYMSPERVEGSYGPPADVWSFGVTLIALATGRPPFPEDSYFGIVKHILKNPPPSLPDHVQCSPQFRSFLAACLHKDPAQRWPADALLRHPFLAPPAPGEEFRPEDSPLARPTPSDLDALHLILQHLLKTEYLRPPDAPPDAPPVAPYRRSLYEMARFQRVASELGLSTRLVQEAFEERYRELVARAGASGAPRAFGDPAAGFGAPPRPLQPPAAPGPSAWDPPRPQHFASARPQQPQPQPQPQQQPQQQQQQQQQQQPLRGPPPARAPVTRASVRARGPPR
jgi:serine/threonine protein kinase